MAQTLILVADGKAERRDSVATTLVAAGFAQRVQPCESGRRLVTEFARALRAGNQVGAVVLDVQLPVVGGKTCSIALRCIERAFSVASTPLVFHAQAPADANLKRVLDYVGAAVFVCRQEAADLPSSISNELRKLVP